MAFLALSKLDAHWSHILLSTLSFQLVFLISGSISSRLSRSYPKLSDIKKIDWCIKVTSFVHAVIICASAFPLLWDPALKDDRIFGYSYYGGEVFSIATGYFLWDTLITAYYIKLFGVGFLVHGIAALFSYLFSLTPFLMYYGAIFILYELSTPFLDIHWFLDKTGRTGSMLQLVNGICLLLTFFTVRIVFGLYFSFHFLTELFSVRNQIPIHLFLIYSSTCIILNSLNVVWFRAMIHAIRKRFKKID